MAKRRDFCPGNSTFTFNSLSWLLAVLLLALWPWAAHAQSSDPRGLWHFDQCTDVDTNGVCGGPTSTGDTTEDSGPNGNDATVVGATWNQGKLN
ncbi:MAG: hypothetical protein HY647_09670, partial [Acidobacteria bacterium]|nr:hypothetical protein [Acidobacteriota bacterium]